MAVVGGTGRVASVAVRRRGVLGLDGAARDLALVAAVAIPFAVRYPIAASILSLAAFGLVHTFLELRWVLDRFKAFLAGPFLWALAAPVTVIAANRLIGGPKPVEVAAGFGLLAVALVQGLRTGRLRTWPAAAAGAALAVGLAASLGSPAMYGIVLAHVHNTVTGVLLWEWSSDWAEDRRRRFRTGLAVCFAAVPALILAGAADWALPDAVSAGGPTGILMKAVTPPDWTATTAGIRLVAVFTFLQLVHYGVWCWLLPRRAPVPSSASSESSASPAAPRAAWAAAAGVATGVLALVFLTDYVAGRTLYTTLATYHAYLEFPVVLVLLGGSRAVR